MEDDDYYEPADDIEETRRPRDRKIDEAKQALLEKYFQEDNKNVYYGRQLEIALESQFFSLDNKKSSDGYPLDSGRPNR